MTDISKQFFKDTIIHLRFFLFIMYVFVFQDYPSVGQILQKARENNINIIFVIGGKDNKFIRNIYYDKFATYLPGGFNNASELTTDASNILDIVGNSYRVNMKMPLFSSVLLMIKYWQKLH